jgi:hypothetical protein
LRTTSVDGKRPVMSGHGATNGSIAAMLDIAHGDSGRGAVAEDEAAWMDCWPDFTPLYCAKYHNRWR